MGLVCGTLLVTTACLRVTGVVTGDINSYQVAISDIAQTTTNSEKADNPVTSEEEYYQKALANFEKAIIIVRNNRNDIPVHYLGLYKREFDSKDCEYGFYLETITEDYYLYRLAEYPLFEEDYDYAVKLYEDKQFPKNEVSTGEYFETYLSGNLEEIKTNSDPTVLDVYSKAIFDKEYVKQSEASEEFEKYYTLLDERRGEASNSFLVYKITTYDGKDLYFVGFITKSGKYNANTNVMIDKSLAEQIAKAYNSELSDILNYVLNKDEFVIKADDETLKAFTEVIKAKVELVKPWQK